MAGVYPPWWRRWLRRWLPFLFKRCPDGNDHWRWDLLCCCRLGEYSDGWHGGILHFASGKEWFGFQRIAGEEVAKALLRRWLRLIREPESEDVHLLERQTAAMVGEMDGEQQGG